MERRSTVLSSGTEMARSVLRVFLENGALILSFRINHNIFVSQGLRWNDTPCSFETYFVCEVWRFPLRIALQKTEESDLWDFVTLFVKPPTLNVTQAMLASAEKYTYKTLRLISSPSTSLYTIQCLLSFILPPKHCWQVLKMVKQHILCGTPQGGGGAADILNVLKVIGLFFDFQNYQFIK